MNGQLKTSGKPTTRILSMVLATAACAGSLVLHAPASARADSACADTTAGLVLGVGADTHLSEQVDQSGMKDEGLTGVIKWRQDALDSTAKLWDGQTIKDYLSQHGISQDTYLHPAWNHDLERIAIQRSAEANVNFGHVRPNGQAWNSVSTTSGAASEAEVLSSTDMPDAIDSWASEKQVVLDNPTADNSQTAGHYRFLINPTYRGYGFGVANGNSAIGEASTQVPSDQTPVGWSATCDFRIPTLASDLTATMSPSSIALGLHRQVVASATGTWTGWFRNGAPQRTTFQLRGNYSAADPSVVSFANSASGATMSAGAVGTTAVSMDSMGQTIPLGQVTVLGKTITGVEDPAAITTASGTAPTLPATVQATWNDGTVTSEPVTWDALPSTWRSRTGGRFSVNGTVAAWAKPVKVVVTVTPATPASVAPVQVWTLVGLAPVLPTQAQVIWSNGDTTTDPVTWNQVADGSYAQPGTFTVPGQVTVTEAGQASLAASAIVTVSAKDASSGFSPMTETPPTATGLLGEATGDKLADVWGIDAAGTLDFYRYTPTGLVKVGVRGTQLNDISYLAPVQDQNGDGRADLLYRTRSDGSLWIAYNLGNGYLAQGRKVGANWNGMDQIFYAGHMIAGSNAQFVLARNAADGSLWRYALTGSGLSHGVQVGHGWGGMRTMFSPGNMWGDAGWDVIGIGADGSMYGYRSQNGTLITYGRVGVGWRGTPHAFIPGDLTGDGRLDLMGERDDGSVWAYRNTGAGWTTLGQRASGFAYPVIG